MKIYFVVNMLSVGGAERVCSELANYFSTHGDIVNIILTSAHVKESYSIGGASKEYLDEKKINGFTKIYRLTKILQKEKPDVVIAFPDPCSFYGAIASKIAHIPCICSERNAPRFQPVSAIKRILRLLAYESADRVVFQTEDSMNYFGGKIQKKGVLIPNPFDTDGYVMARVFSERENIISIGRIVPQKNFSLLIEAFSIVHKMYPSICLEIYGEGETKETIKINKKIDILGLNKCVFLKGFVRDVKTRISKAKLFVSSSDYEGMPNALIEAAAAGLPCVATDSPVGGTRYIIKGNSADVLTPVGDANALAQGMISILKNYEASSKKSMDYGEYLRKSLSIEAVCEKWKAVMMDITKKDL